MTETKTDTDLGDRVARLAAEVTLGEHALITAIGEFEASGQWAREGAVSCAQWVSWRIAMSGCAGRERVRMAKALRDLPLINAAFRQAQLSYSKVRAVTRVATAVNEAMFLEIARTATASQLEAICRKFRGCMQEGRPEVAEDRRRMSITGTDHGTTRIIIELPADEGARFEAAVESGQAALRDEGVSADGPRALTTAPYRSKRVDGLMAVVESWFAEGARPRRGGAPNEVMLHVSADTGDRANAWVDAAGGLGVSAAAARRLCCDASVSAVVEDSAGNVLDVGRKRRTVPPAMARALEAREGRKCSFPGCTHTMFLDKHHIQHWADGGRTCIENLTQICRRHHTFVHEHGWRIEKTDGVATFFSPGGDRVEAAPPLPAVTEGGLQAMAEDRSVALDDVLVTEAWSEEVDFVQIIDVLAYETMRRSQRGAAAAQP